MRFIINDSILRRKARTIFNEIVIEKRFITIKDYLSSALMHVSSGEDICFSTAGIETELFITSALSFIFLFQIRAKIFLRANLA